ncbi:MAG: DivIVA domain-containing protein [Clostridiaceae bacterium]
MFLQVVILAVILGYLFRGNLKNLASMKIEGVYLIVMAFVVEASIIIPLNMGVLHVGQTTMLMDIVMYALLFIFILKNIKNPYIIIVGIGFALNAAAIFANGGAMPVSSAAYQAVGLTGDAGSMGLYAFINENTKLWFLGDIIPYDLIDVNILSIGDIISSLGIMLLIIMNMRKPEIKEEESDMPLLPAEIVKKDIKKSIYGYSQEEVDQFLYRLSTEYKELYNENSQLKKKIFAAEDRVKRYAALEKSIKETLELSKSTSAQARENSHDKSDLIIKEARETALNNIEDAKAQLEVMKGNYDSLKEEFDRFCHRHKSFMDAQVDILKDMEKRQDENM